MIKREINSSVDDGYSIERSTEFIKNLVSLANAQGHSFACWSLPDDRSLNVIIDTSGAPKKGKISLENSSPGFLVSPYNNSGLQSSYFLNADIRINSVSNQLWIDPMAGGTKLEIIHKLVETASTSDCFEYIFNFHSKPARHIENDKNHYLKMVEQAKSAIIRQELKKVVLSRAKDWPIELDIHPFELFKNIVSTMPRAFVSFISVKGLGTWIGASPEILIEIKESRFFRTVSLAGTQPVSNYNDLSEVSWKQKEIEEQALVSRYIIDCFKKIRLREYEEEGPKTVRASNLIHLMSEFKVDMLATNFEQLGSVMLELLHPTSAVCGMPLNNSKAFIEKYENYDRELYSGFWGPVNVTNDTFQFVNLRCMQLSDQNARLYAGAGITENSDALKEWEETEAKLQTMYRFIESHIKRT